MAKKRKRSEPAGSEGSLLFQVRFVAALRFVVGAGVLSLVALVSGIWWLSLVGVAVGLFAAGSLVMSWRLDPERLSKGGWRW